MWQAAARFLRDVVQPRAPVAGSRGHEDTLAHLRWARAMLHTRCFQFDIGEGRCVLTATKPPTDSNQ